MKRITAVVIAIAALFIVFGAPAANAQQCSPQSYSYDTGGAPGGGPVNDPLFAKQWALDQINAPEAWARGARGAGTTIAVVDTGVDLGHPDLNSKLVAGTDIVASNGDCPAGPQDENGHGTHVAGIAAAVTDNGIGVAGVAPDASLMPVRVLDAARTYSRRFLEFDLATIVEHESAFGVFWGLLRAEATSASGGCLLDAAVDISEAHRAAVRASLQEGVHEALGHLHRALGAAAGNRRRAREARVTTDGLVIEALQIVYRVLFLLFAEARGLVRSEGESWMLAG